MKRVNRKDFYLGKGNSVLYLTSGDDNSKTSSSFLKYLIAHLIMIGQSLIFSSLLKQNLNYDLLKGFK